jgi:conjugal transfer pilus assembly protein TraB
MINKIIQWIKTNLNKLTALNKPVAQLDFDLPEETGFDSQERESLLTIKKKQKLMLVALIAAVAVSVMIVASFLGKSKTNSSNKTSSSKQKESGATKEGSIKIEIASDALDPDKMWRNHFEDKLDNTKTAIDESLAGIQDSVSETEVRLQQKTSADLAAMSSELRIATANLEAAMNEIRAFREEQTASKEEQNDNRPTLAEVASFEIEQAESFAPVKSTRNYIPETVYLQGKLLGGISVSTSMGSQSEPVPVVIRISGNGNLPKNFEMDLSQCRILGSSYGDISSERAVIRLETMICEDKELEQVITTKVAGIVYGDDGMNGVKGKVVQTSNKLIKNAMIGGLLSGLSQNMQNQGQFALTGLGAVQTQKQGVADSLKGGTLSGASNAAEKIADYYLKQAEAMSPVLLIAGGTKVDIVFTKGVTLGTGDVKERIAQSRNNNRGNKNGEATQ